MVRYVRREKELRTCFPRRGVVSFEFSDPSKVKIFDFKESVRDDGAMMMLEVITVPLAFFSSSWRFHSVLSYPSPWGRKF